MKFLRRIFTFIEIFNFYKQINGYTVGGPLSVTFSDIFMQLKIENKVVTPLQPKFYRGYVDGVFKRCKENVKDIFFFQVS